MFPFTVPDDLTALSAEEFTAFLARVREFAQSVLDREDATPEELTAARDLFHQVSGEDTRRTEAAHAAEVARQDLAAGLTPVDTPAAPVDTPAAPVTPVTTASTIDTAPESTEPERFAVMVASSDAPNMGRALNTFSDAGALIERRLATYPSGKGSLSERQAAQRRIGPNHFRIGGRSLVRHGNIAFRREFPANLRVTDTGDAMRILDYASSEGRLPGGSLLRSTERAVSNGRALTAAVGWCAPSETIYDLCELESMDGILDLPEVQASRGGFFIPSNGGPDFGTIYDAIGDGGDIILSEYDVENDTAKVCTEIPCPAFEEVRLDVAYVCLTGSLLQSRGYPEAVTRFTRGAMAAMAHKVNESVISRIAAASTNAGTISTIAGSDDAASQLLSAVELAIEDIKYRNRMSRSATIEIVLPAWVMAPIRAALARRRGVMAINVTDAEILSAFTTRRAVPHFVYDWQDAYSGLSGGPGGSTPITAFPDSVQFLVYPAGTWVKAVRDVVNLDTVYDNALLTQNQYTALFVEDGFNTLQMCADSRLYEVDVDPAGITGCCPTS